MSYQRERDKGVVVEVGLDCSSWLGTTLLLLDLTEVGSFQAFSAPMKQWELDFSEHHCSKEPRFSQDSDQ